MAKTQTPFLSLGAKGSVGGSITAQTLKGVTMLREKPIPADPYSLPQAYQRWLYEDYAYLWTLQTSSVQASYRLSGSKHHRTAFQEWMSDKLFNLPDIAGMWHLDEKSGAIAHDSSRNANHGTIYGASPASGLIDRAFSFDGINNYLDCGNSPTLKPTKAISIEAFGYFHKDDTTQYLIQRGRDITSGYHILRSATNFIIALVQGQTGTSIAWAPTLKNTWYHITFSYLSGSGGMLYLDGTPVMPTANCGDILYPDDTNLNIGVHIFGLPLYYLEGFLDHLIIRNRTLDDTEIKRHSERRYPQ